MEYGYCNVCKIKLTSPTSYKFHRGKKLCLNCYENTVVGTKNTDLQRKHLEEYICNLFDFQELPIPYSQQIDKFIREYKMTPKGIEAALHYFYVLMENDIANDVYMGIIPRVYDEAKEYYKNLNKTIQINNEFIRHEETQIVTIKKPDGSLPSKTRIEEWD